MPAHHSFSPASARSAAPASGFGRRPSLDNGLHEQLLGTQAAASRARRGHTLRLALGFAAFGVVAALWSGPNVEEAIYQVALTRQGEPSERITTASITPVAPVAQAPQAQASRYVVRRSVLTEPGIVCVVTPDESSCK